MKEFPTFNNFINMNLQMKEFPNFNNLISMNLQNYIKFIDVILQIQYKLKVRIFQIKICTEFVKIT
jgi:hypothetical protein